MTQRSQSKLVMHWYWLHYVILLQLANKGWTGVPEEQPGTHTQRCLDEDVATYNLVYKNNSNHSRFPPCNQLPLLDWYFYHALIIFHTKRLLNFTW